MLQYWWNWILSGCTDNEFSTICEVLPIYGSSFSVKISSTRYDLFTMQTIWWLVLDGLWNASVTRISSTMSISKTKKNIIFSIQSLPNLGSSNISAHLDPLKKEVAFCEIAKNDKNYIFYNLYNFNTCRKKIMQKGRHYRYEYFV